MKMYSNNYFPTFPDVAENFFSIKFPINGMFLIGLKKKAVEIGLIFGLWLILLPTNILYDIFGQIKPFNYLQPT